MHKKLSIIIVHYNTPELLKDCLNSLYEVKQKQDQWEVIVVDNGSSEGSKKELRVLANIEQFKPFLRVIFEEKNHGFSGGNNIAIREAKGDFVLLLNSDTQLQKNAIQETLTVFDDETVGAATCKLVLPDGSIDPACHRGFPTPWAAFTYFSKLETLFPFIPLFSHYHQWYKNLSRIHEIDVPSGAFFLIRKTVLETIGLLDEDFFMYGEDIDLAYRIKQAGFKILFVPQVQILHIKKQSGRDNNNKAIREKTNYHFYDTMKLFYKKHYLKKYPALLTWIIFLLLDIRKRL